MSDSYENITCAVLTRADLESRKSRFLELIERFDLTTPTHVGNEEPIKVRYGGIANALELWGDPFLWRSAKTKSRGNVWMGRGGNHAGIFINISPARGLDRSEDLVRFLGELGTLLDADFGYVHYTTEVEQNHPDSDYGAVYAVDIGVTTFDLRCGIPNVCWAMWLGAPYSNVVAGLRLFANGGFTLLEEHGVCGMMRVNVPLSSLRSDFEGFCAIRNRIRDEFAPGCFGTKKKPSLWHPEF